MDISELFFRTLAVLVGLILTAGGVKLKQEDSTSEFTALVLVTAGLVLIGYGVLR